MKALGFGARVTRPPAFDSASTSLDVTFTILMPSMLSTYLTPKNTRPTHVRYARHSRIVAPCTSSLIATSPASWALPGVDMAVPTMCQYTHIYQIHAWCLFLAAVSMSI